MDASGCLKSNEEVMESLMFQRTPGSKGICPKIWN